MTAAIVTLPFHHLHISIPSSQKSPLTATVDSNGVRHRFVLVLLHRHASAFSRSRETLVRRRRQSRHEFRDTILLSSGMVSSLRTRSSIRKKSIMKVERMQQELSHVYWLAGSP